jgi:hypothetical protein
MLIGPSKLGHNMVRGNIPINNASARLYASSIAINVYGMILVIADMTHWTYTNMHAARICGRNEKRKYRPPYIPAYHSTSPLW